MIFVYWHFLENSFFILWPENENVKILSDFNAIIVANYESKTEGTNIAFETRLKPACEKVGATIVIANVVQ